MFAGSKFHVPLAKYRGQYTPQAPPALQLSRVAVVVIFRFRNTKIPIPTRSDTKQKKFSIPRAMGICASRALIGAGARRKRNNEVNSDVWASALIVVLPPPSFCLFVETHIGFGFMGLLERGQH